jgi:hypothetical protein
VGLEVLPHLFFRDPHPLHNRGRCALGQHVGAECLKQPWLTNSLLLDPPPKILEVAEAVPEGANRLVEFFLADPDLPPARFLDQVAKVHQLLHR